MNVISGGYDTALTETYLGFFKIFILLSFAATALIMVSRRRIFKKLGMPGWKGLIPIYSDYKLFKSRWRALPFWILMLSTIAFFAGIFLTNYALISNISEEMTFSSIEEARSFFSPYLVSYGLLMAAYAVIGIAVTLNLNYRIAESYEEGFGYALGLTVLPIVFYPILAFAKKQTTRRKRPLQFVSAALTLALVFSIFTCAPFSVSAAENDDLAETSADAAAPFGELDWGEYTLESKTYQLSDDFAAEGYLHVPSDVTAVIDLNGHTIDRGQAVSSALGFVIKNNGTLTITDSSGNDSGKITGGYAEFGGGVSNFGTLTIEGGTLTGNRASKDGGAVFNAGAFSFTGGVVRGNAAGRQGGGIYSNTSIQTGGSPIVADNANGNLWLYSNSVIEFASPLTNGANIDVGADNMPRAVTSDFSGSDASAFTFAGGVTQATVNNDGEIVPDVKATTTVDSWSALKSAVSSASNGDVIALEADIASSGGDSDMITVNNKTITIDLCGHTMDRKRNSSCTDGHVIWVTGSSKLTLKDTYGGGVIKGGYASNGGAFSINNQATLNLYNVTLSDNKATNGGAIAVWGSLNINGAVIKNNIAEDGGAVKVNSDAAAFHAVNAVFSGNESTQHGGGAVTAYDEATFENCLISGNRAHTSGGGVWTEAALTMTDCNVSHNTAENNSGGGIYAKKVLNLTGCVISANTCAEWGGGVYLPDAAGAILNLTDGRIENNTCGTNGGGVHISEEVSMTVAGSPVVKNNTAGTGDSAVINNVRLTEYACIDANGSLTDGTEIGISLSRYNRVPIIGLTAESDINFFTLDEEGAGRYDLTKKMEKYGQDNYQLRVEAIEKAAVDSWSALQSEISSTIESTPKCITLSDNITAGGSQTRIRIAGDKEIIIDLNGKTLNRNRGSKDTDGHVIEVFGDLTVKDSAGGGKITGGFANNGGGVNIADGGSFTLQSGTITGNKGDKGGGVHVKSGGTFKMTGGAVDGNKSDDDGGGVYVADDSAVFTLSGGTISNNTSSEKGGGIFSDYQTTITGGKIEKNKAEYGGGICFDDSRITLNFSGVTISENTATEQGGAIYLQAGSLDVSDSTIQYNTSADGTVYVKSGNTFNATNTTFKNNKVTARGGGAIVNNSGEVTLTTCTLDGNTAKNSAGAIWTNNTLTVIDSTITNNKANNGPGGAIMVSEGTLNLYGGTIKGNSATGGGSGIYINSDAAINMKGKVVLNNNAGSNLLLNYGKKIKIVGSLLEGSDINVAIKDNSATVTNGYKTYHEGENPALYFSAMDGSSVTTDSKGEVMVIDSEWTILRNMFEEAEDGSTIKLDRDWTAIPKDKSIVVPAGKSITLDLNGHNIDAAGALSVPVIDVKGSLTITDTYVPDPSEASSSTTVDEDEDEDDEETEEDKTPKITGGKCANGSALYIYENAEVVLQGGAIYGNTADSNGAIYNKGTLTVSGGIIKKNTSKYGGAIYNDTAGTVNVTGGEITGNTASEFGGGIYNKGTLNVEGGLIDNNDAVRQGGGIYLDENGVLNVGRIPVVKENRAPIGNNILLTSGTAVTVTSDLNPGSYLDVVTDTTRSPLTSGWSSHLNQGTFTYNGTADVMETRGDGERYLKESSWATFMSTAGMNCKRRSTKPKRMT